MTPPRARSAGSVLALPSCGTSSKRTAGPSSRTATGQATAPRSRCACRRVAWRATPRAADAIDILAEWRPDVLLTDIAMPGEDGYALMRRVRALPGPVGTIPAVALTAFTDPQSMQNAFAAGFDAHVGKPLEPHVLADALSKVLRMRR